MEKVSSRPIGLVGYRNAYTKGKKNIGGRQRERVLRIVLDYMYIPVSMCACSHFVYKQN